MTSGDDGIPPDHEPDEAVRRRAEAAGYDLDRLRREEPATYRILNAAPLLRTSPELMDAVGEAYFAAAPHGELFSLPEREGLVWLSAFPPPDPALLETLDERLAQRVAQPPLVGRGAYYRVVEDLRGVRRELALPTPPDAWDGHRETVVGPFAGRDEADRWGRDHVMGRGELTFDAVRLGDAWYCDVFSAAGL